MRPQRVSPRIVLPRALSSTRMALVACSALLAASAAHAGGSLQDATDLRQKRFGSQRSLEEHLAQFVEQDAAFDSERRRSDMAPYMRAVYDGLYYLLSNELRTQFLGLSSDALRGEWLRRYWVLRDPTPTTPRNEYREEHERRVRLARARFPAPGPPGWDDRGVFMILYGPPQAERDVLADVREANGYLPERKLWYYDDGLIVPFQTRIPGGEVWTFGLTAQWSSSRSDLREDAKAGYADLVLGYGARPILYNADRPKLYEVDPAQGVQMALLQARASEVFEQRIERIVLPGPPRSRLWFVFDNDAFAAAADTRTRMETHVQVSLADLEFELRSERHVARLGIEGVLFDAKLREAARDAYQETLTADALETTRTQRLVPGQLTFEVRPGTYRLAVRVVDLTSLAEGAYTTDVDVPSFEGPQLRLSDIELATKIVPPDGRRTRFEKTGRVVVPNPIGAYQDTDALTAYFEIYGLVRDEGTSRYRIDYEIVSHQRRQHDGWFPKRGTEPVASVTSSFAGSGTTSNSMEVLRVDIGVLKQATYDLVVTVHDLVAGTQAESSTAFSVVRH